MPEISDSTAREQYTIAGENFNVAQPYGEGHVLTAGEASALNQTYAENIRNNFAAKVKEAKEAGSFDLQAFQAKLDDYMAEYEFGQRTGGGSRDPVMKEAMDIARDKVRQAIRKQNIDLKTVDAKDITEMAKAAIAKNPAILELAKQRVAAIQDVGEISLDLEPATAAPAKKAKAEA